MNFLCNMKGKHQNAISTSVTSVNNVHLIGQCRPMRQNLIDKLWL